MRSIIALSLLAGAFAGGAWAAGFPPLIRKPVLDQPLPTTTVARYAKGASITFAPGQPTPLHRHPAAVIGVVTKGSFLFQPDGQPVRTLHTGDGFYEPAGVRILKFDNASNSEPAAITAFYLLSRADEPLIEILPGK